MDAKLRKLRIRYGMEGYGLYWYCLELICKDVKVTNLTFELEHDSEIISHDTGLNYKAVEEMVKYMVDLNLFESGGGMITCMKMARRLDQSMTSNPKMRNMIAQAKKNHDTIMMPSGHRHDDPENSENGLEIKELNNHHDTIMTASCKKRKKEENRRGKNFSPPTLQQVQSRCQEMGYSVDPSRFVNFYESKGWMVGKNKMKSWTAALANWASGDKSRSPQGGLEL